MPKDFNEEKNILDLIENILLFTSCLFFQSSLYLLKPLFEMD